MIIIEQTKKATFNDAYLNEQSSNFNDCIITEFVINTNEIIKVYMMEFELSSETKPYFNDKGKHKTFGEQLKIGVSSTNASKTGHHPKLSLKFLAWSLLPKV